jgi:hypothetical protein
MIHGNLRLQILIGILLLGRILYGQDIIKEKTLSIVDTSGTKINQAHEIYSWITSNIEYDVKSFLKGSSSNKSASETLKRRKGICYDYSLLFKEMCNSAGIESYLVLGYNKGAEFYKGSGFYRADHCWNSIIIDTSWILVDATWGSGYLERIPTQIDKLKFYLFKIPYVNKKLRFVQAPTDKYFNPAFDSLRQTHMPLDPKWQLRKYPFSIGSFESDSSNQTISLTDNQEKLRNARKLSETAQIFEEGLNGKEFNIKNNFNISIGFLIKASEFDYEAAPITSSGIQIFKEYSGYYKKSIEFISLYNRAVDSIYILRLNSIRTDIRNGQNLGNKIKQEYKTDKKSFGKKQSALSKRYSGLLNRIETYERKIADLQLDSVYKFDKLKTTNPDTSALNNSIRNLVTSIKKCGYLEQEIDSSLQIYSKQVEADSILTTKFQATNMLFRKELSDFIQPLSKEDNLQISRSWNNLFTSFKSTRELMKYKASNLTAMQNEYSKLILDISLLVSRYQNQIEAISTYYKNTSDSTRSIIMYRRIIDYMTGVYDKAKELTFDYRDLNGKLYRFNDENFRVNAEIIKPATKYIQLFVKYENILLARQELSLKNEKSLVNDINKKANRGLQAINGKIGKYLAVKHEAQIKNGS